MKTFYFNGTFEGNAYQAKVSERCANYYNVDTIVFDKTTGEPVDGYERMVPSCGYTPKQAARAVVRNPFQF